MLHANTRSYIAKNLEITRNGNSFQFKFEHRVANVPIDTRFNMSESLNKVALTAATQLFTQDCLGALLTLRLQGDKMRD